MDSWPFFLPFYTAVAINRCWYCIYILYCLHSVPLCSGEVPVLLPHIVLVYIETCSSCYICLLSSYPVFPGTTPRIQLSGRSQLLAISWGFLIWIIAAECREGCVMQSSAAKPAKRSYGLWWVSWVQGKLSSWRNLRLLIVCCILWLKVIPS